MSGGWNWAAGPWNAGPQIPLSAATARGVTWRRKGNHEASFTLTVTKGGPDDVNEERAVIAALTALTPLVSDIWITYRDATGGTQWLPPLRLGGYSRAGDARKLVTNYGAACYRELLRRRNIPPGKTVTWAATSPIDAAWTVLSQEQTRPGSNLGIVRGPHPAASTVGTLDVQVGDKVGGAIDTLAGLGDGADWDIVRTSETGLRFDMWTPQRGVDNGVAIALGGAAASMPTDTLDPTTYANGLQGTGQAPSGGGTQPAPQLLDAADIATRPEGRWDAVESTDQTSTGAILSRLGVLLADRQLLTPSRTVRLARGWWQGPAHLWLGDPLEYVAQVGPLRIISTETVEEIKADFSKPGDPDIDLTFGVPPRNPRYRVLAVDRRLASLELRA